MRKRVCKVLRDIFIHSLSTNNDIDQDILVDIGVKLIGRFVDEEDSIQDMAKKFIAQIYFQQFKKQIEESKKEDSQDIMIRMLSQSSTKNYRLLSLNEQQAIEKRAVLFSKVLNAGKVSCTLVVEFIREKLNKSTTGVAKSEQISACSSIKAMVEYIVDKVIDLDFKENKVKRHLFNSI